MLQVLGGLIATSWTIGLVYGFGPAFNYRFRNDIGCDFHYVFGPAQSVYGGLAIFLPTSISTLVFYSLIGRLVLQKRGSDAVQVFVVASSGQGADSRSAPLRSKLIALKAPVVVFGVFFLSWSPHLLVYVFHDVGMELPRSTRLWVTNLGLLNSAMNFFVYLLFNRQFREALPVRACRCRRWWRKNRVGSMQPTGILQSASTSCRHPPSIRGRCLVCRAQFQTSP